MNCEKIKNNIGIRTVLESFNLFPEKENSKTAFYFAFDRDEETPSLSVDFVKNMAFDFGTGKSYDIISIVQYMNKCSVSEALKYLEKYASPFQEKENYEKEDLSKSYQILQVSEIKHPALIQYLKSRKVYKQRNQVKEVYYELNRKKYFGISFFNNSGGVEIRNKYSKICLGRKDVTVIQHKSGKSNEITVFEGFLDYLTFKNLEEKKNATSDFLILNSTAMLFKAEETLKEYSKISLFLDNDDNGIATQEIIRKKYKNVEDCSLLYRDCKDLNEWFCICE